jgi:hypothetical protein
MADYTSKWTGAQIDTGIEFVPCYATCDTAAATQAKVATIVAGTFSLTAGKTVTVKFTNAQTYNGQPTLNVGGTGAKSIVKNGTTAGIRYQWQAGEVVQFVYDGTNFVEVNGATATTTYFGVTKLTTSVASTSTTTAATPSSVKTAYDLAATKAEVQFLTQSEYDALTTKSTTTLYCITG